MQTFSKLFTLLGMALGALAVPRHPHLAPACSLANDDITTVIPASMFDPTLNARPLQSPIHPHPVFLVLGVGTANYTCQSDGTWSAVGGLLELFDFSCVPFSERDAKTQEVYQKWVNAPSHVTAPEIVKNAWKYTTKAWGQHYWVADPNNPADGTFNPKWDFAARQYHDVLAGSTDESAWLIGYRTGIVPAPVDPADNIEWVSLSALDKADGTPWGTFAEQVYRIYCYGGVASEGSCGTAGEWGLFKTALTFWYYGGAWDSQ